MAVSLATGETMKLEHVALSLLLLATGTSAIAAPCELDAYRARVDAAKKAAAEQDDSTQQPTAAAQAIGCGLSTRFRRV